MRSKFLRLTLMLRIAVCFILINACDSAPSDPANDGNNTTGITGEYLGQTPPGRELIQFAPEFVPQGSHASVTVSPDGQEIYWTSNTSIIVTKLLNERWTTPEVVSFSGQGTRNFYDDVPVISPDNTKLFFSSWRQLGSSTKENIWYVERTQTGWGEPIPVSDNVNNIYFYWQISVSNSGTLYFSGLSPNTYGEYDIYYSTFVNGEYTTPVNMGPVINGQYGESCPFIDPNESYILFSKIIAGRSTGIYISFKSQDGEWLVPQKLEALNNNIVSFVSRDGRYIFTHNYWISAEIIENLRP
ncbi:hypothetical protein ACFLTH_16665 [Bacteroidota bacterium]